MLRFPTGYRDYGIGSKELAAGRHLTGYGQTKRLRRQARPHEFAAQVWAQRVYPPSRKSWTYACCETGVVRTPVGQLLGEEKDNVQ